MVAIMAIRQLFNKPTAGTSISASTHSTPAARMVAKTTKPPLMPCSYFASSGAAWPHAMCSDGLKHTYFV
jgi:hypothetical protein